MGTEEDPHWRTVPQFHVSTLNKSVSEKETETQAECFKTWRPSEGGLLRVCENQILLSTYKLG